MSLDELQARWDAEDQARTAWQALEEKYESDRVRFAGVEPKLSQRADLHAFMLLDRLAPGTGDIVTAAEHDKVWLDVDIVALMQAASEDDIRDLLRCGVHLDEDGESLALNV